MHRTEALYYNELSDKSVKCELCPHNCKINEASTGLCKVRRNIDGKLYSLNYGKIISLMVDPIEKKPLYHFYPGSRTLSLAMQGCNLKCEFCQNSSISQLRDATEITGEELSPENIISIAKAKNIDIISYTYTEPTIFYEFMLETSMLARNSKIKNVMVTNGFINEDPLREILKFMNAFNVDLKTFRDNTYREVIGGRLDVLIDNLEIIVKSKSWLEITTLFVPGMNDSVEEKEDLAKFIANLGKDIPWHLSKYYPHYKMTDKAAEETSMESLLEAYEIAKAAGLNYVYMGNIMDKKYNSTSCHACGKEIITRQGYSVSIEEEEGVPSLKSKCRFCGAIIPGVFKKN